MSKLSEASEDRTKYYHAKETIGYGRIAQEAVDDSDAQHERLSQHYKHDPELTKIDGPLDQYTGAGSHDINRHLLTNTERSLSDKHKEALAGMRKLVSDAPAAPEDIHAYSGVSSVLRAHLRALKPGDSFTSNAFLSSSLNPGVTGMFGTDVAHFHIPKGHKAGAYIGHVSRMESEHEFVVAPHTKWKYVGSEDVTRPFMQANKTPYTAIVHHFVPEEETK